MSNIIKEVSLVSNKDLILNASDEAIERALRYIGIEWQGAAADMCPVVTGRLAASITYITVKGKGEPTKALLKKDAELQPADYTARANPERHTVVLGTNVEYAEKIENGGAREERHSHYIRRGLTENVSRFKEIAENELKGS